MDHLAIDVGGRESQTCLRASDGTIVQEGRCLTRTLPVLFEKMSPSRVVMETCAESLWLADAARAAGHDVRVVAATLVPALGVGARQTKTDQRDARVLSEASCRIELPSVHVRSRDSREIQTQLSMHDGLVASRTMLVNTVRGWMRTVAARCRSGGTETFPKRVRAALGEAVPTYIERQLATIDQLTAAIDDAERELEQRAKKRPECARLMTVPGVGAKTALAFVATLDCPERFADAHHVQAYLGLTPGEHSSSDRQRRTGITKAGSTRTRWLLVQAAWAMRRSRVLRKSTLRAWSLGVEKRRGKRVAVVALARKLAGILFAMWRDATPYQLQQAVDLPQAI